MKTLLLLGFFLLSALFANESFDEDTNQTQEFRSAPKVLYLSTTKIPQRILKGEIFAYTIKTLPTLENFNDITYKQENGVGLNSLHAVPYRKKSDRYFYDTFYFLVTQSQARLPDFTATIHTEGGNAYPDATLYGQELNIVTLNPKNDFAGIIADSFEIVEYKTTSYDDTHNIVVFVAKANNCAISALHLNNVVKQGIESISKSHFESKITYFAIVEKGLENLSFSYFNLKNNNYSLLSIPIIVEDDSVATQSDLTPKDYSKDTLKVSIAVAVALIGAVFFVWRRKYIYIVVVLLPLGYAATIVVPAKDVCIQANAPIYLLPMEHATVFETTATQIELQKEGSVERFTKVKLQNDKIGWVKNEDICAY
ncbi:MAG: hypothetical protein PHI89_05635 [Thiovulaceae bacterium]|nr:hypothetical protein [Sulfurimonadaceae bacterium]